MLVHDVMGGVEVWWPNFYMTGATAGIGMMETSNGGAATATALVGYYDADTGAYAEANFIDMTGGTTALAASDGGFFKAIAPIKAKRGSRIYLRIRGNNPNGFYYAAERADYLNGDLLQFGASVPALNTVPINTHTTGGFYYGPTLVMGMTAEETAGILGDSREAGYDDIPDTAFGAGGQFERLFEGRIATVNLAAGGDAAVAFNNPVYSARRREALAYAKPTRLAIGFGINELYFNGESETDTLARIQAIGAVFGFAPSDIIYKTLDPASTDVNNTAVARPLREATRLAFNVLVRAMPKYFDPASVLQAVSNIGLWFDLLCLVDDGTHESAYANKKAVAEGGFAYSNIGSPAIMTFLPWTPETMGAQLAYHGPHSGITGLNASDNSMGFFACIQIADLAADSPLVLPNGSGGFNMFISAAELIGVARYSAAVQVVSSGGTTVPLNRPSTIGVDMVQSATLRSQFGIDSQIIAGDRVNNNAFTAGRALINSGLSPSISVLGNVIVTTGVLSNPLRQRIHGFMAWREGAQANIHASSPYRAAPPTL